MSDHEKIRCWSCDAFVSLDERSEADGDCPHCNAEIDLEEYLRQAMKKVQELLCRIDELKAGQGEAVAFAQGNLVDIFEDSTVSVIRREADDSYTLPLYLAPPVSADAVSVPREFVRFLLGEADLNGYSFGDMHQVRVGKFWWRTELRAMIAQQGKAAGDE